MIGRLIAWLLTGIFNLLGYLVSVPAIRWTLTKIANLFDLGVIGGKEEFFLYKKNQP